MLYHHYCSTCIFTTNLHLSAETNNGGAIPPLPPGFMASQGRIFLRYLLLFIIYLKMVLIIQTIQHRMTLSLMNNELDRVWKGVTVASFEILSWHLPGGTEVNHETQDSSTAYILTQDLQSTKH
jgi:hypothetical protein